MRHVALILLAVCQASTALAAATIESSATGVSVKGAQVAVGASIEAGTRVAVLRGKGDTVLRFDESCEVVLHPGQVYTVPRELPCVRAATVPLEPVAPPIGIAPLAIGGVAAAGAIAGIAVAVSNSSSSKNPLPLSY